MSIDIVSNKNKISFLEFTLEIPEQLIHALKVFAKVKDVNDEKPKSEWLKIYEDLMKKKTT